MKYSNTNPTVCFVIIGSALQEDQYQSHVSEINSVVRKVSCDLWPANKH